MAITPTGPGGSPPPSRVSQQQAHEAEKEARDRINLVRHQVQEAQRDAEQKLDHTMDAYAKRTEAEASRQEESYENQKQKGYEAIRDLKRAQQAELNRIRREGEKEITDTRHQTGDAIRATSLKGEAELSQVQNQANQSTELEKKKGLEQTTLAQQSYAQRLKDLKTNQETKFAEISTQAELETEKARTNATTSIEKTTQNFQERFNKTRTDQDQTLDRLNETASRRLTEIREDTSLKLTAYEDRQSDPFYRMMNLDAKLEDKDDHFVLTANIPPHERNRVSVSIRGDQVVLSGHRSNEEKLEVSPGHVQSTAAFQSFSESFPLGWPVDAKRLSREFEGDTLVVRIPKKTTYESPVHKAKKKVQPARAERPQFADNLPIGEKTAKKADVGAEPPKKNRGTRPLS